ncbi:hypothetical protein [Actinoplanes sp. NPDC049599]|uniref:hypothetical protein n=1 Tax=Actinoplanes sp. NPDC049599 TaxID=3363903 RepID=UPI0037A7B0C5
MSAGAFAPLRHVPFRFMLAGRTINSLGNAIAPVALAFAVLDLTGSPSDLGLVVGARMLVNVLAGLGIEQFAVAWETSMQEHVPADKLARVYSYDMVGSFVAIPVGQVAAGPIAEAVGVEPTLIGAAVLIGLAVAGMLASREVRNLRHRLPTSPEPGAAVVKESAS